MRSICKTLDIALADVMAFGDNYNDVSMLDIVGVPYIMDGAAAPLSVALYVYAKEQGEFDVAFAIAAILMALALLINLAATLAARYFKRRRDA